jgi:hypothetical protein
VDIIPICFDQTEDVGRVGVWSFNHVDKSTRLAPWIKYSSHIVWDKRKSTDFTQVTKNAAVWLDKKSHAQISVPVQCDVKHRWVEFGDWLRYQNVWTCHSVNCSTSWTDVQAFIQQALHEQACHRDDCKLPDKAYVDMTDFPELINVYSTQEIKTYAQDQTLDVHY